MSAKQPVLSCDSQRTYRFSWLLAMSLVIVAIVAIPFDVVLAQFFMSEPFPGELRNLIHKSEFFGHAYGILGIVFTIYLICEDRRRQLPRVLATAIAAGLLCDLVKILVHRVRPVDFSFASGESTFLGISFLHADSVGQIFESSYHSFPSAHTATAVAFAMALGAMFPQGARWFIVLSGLVAASRFDGGAHYVSDTFIGGLVGYAAGCWMLGQSWVSRWFADYERTRRPVLRKLPEPQPTFCTIQSSYPAGDH
jgi:membrane-associated phospholipid phosphatase